MTKYQKVRAYVIEKIENGEWGAGFKLPSAKQLSDELGISQTWVNNALRSLQEQEIIEGRAGSGRYVL